MTSTFTTHCPVCTAITPQTREDDAGTDYDCPACGPIRVSRSASAIVKTKLPDQRLAALERAKMQLAAGHRAVIHGEYFDDIS